ncbi:Regulator of G-protein signaling 20 [Halotydeus destructor]|nr:Regulator of G-protein signaling 20 [Halotydeus destructor]
MSIPSSGDNFNSTQHDTSTQVTHGGEVDRPEQFRTEFMMTEVTGSKEQQEGGEGAETPALSQSTSDKTVPMDEIVASNVMTSKQIGHPLDQVQSPSSRARSGAGGHSQHAKPNGAQRPSSTLGDPVASSLSVDRTTQSRSPSESKRKEVDENNPPSLTTTETNQTSKGRKSSRKGSKKKEKVSSVSFQEKKSSDIQSEPNSNQSNSDHEANSGKLGVQDKNSNKSRCCFCWCCCCSCSCPTLLSASAKMGKGTKDANKNDQQSPLDHYFSGNDEMPPSVEDVRSWAESFDKLMKCPWGRKVFKDFLKCEYSEENILFWLACEELKNESNSELVEDKAKGIYEDYISILSPKEVSLDSRVRDIINKNMVKPSRESFDEAQLQIYTLMHRDSFPRFINSPMFRKLAQLPTPSRKGSAA